MGSIPFKSAPSVSRNKMKMFGEIAVGTNEKKANRYSFDVTIEKKMVDDKPVVVCRMNCYGYPMAVGPGNSAPMPEEYTDVKKFAKALSDKIITLGEEM